MSTKFLLVAIFAASAWAQSPTQDSIAVDGEVSGASPAALSHLYVELYGSQSPGAISRAQLDLDGRFHFDNVPPGNYNVRVVTGPGEEPLLDESRQLGQFNLPLTLDLPARPTTKPVTSTVSLWELQHPVPKKALHAFDQARRYSREHDTSKATAKLEEAIRIDADFREAHINLGVQYARARRFAEALAQLETALKLGPPVAALYSNLAWIQAALHQYPEAAASARQALGLDPEIAAAKELLDLIHAPEK